MNRYWDYIKLKEILKERGIKQKEFAEQIQMTPTNLSHILNGKTTPKFATVLNMANELEVTPAFFEEGDRYSHAVNENEVELLSFFRKISDKNQQRVIGITQGMALLSDEQDAGSDFVGKALDKVDRRRRSKQNVS